MKKNCSGKGSTTADVFCTDSRPILTSTCHKIESAVLHNDAHALLSLKGDKRILFTELEKELCRVFNMGFL